MSQYWKDREAESLALLHSKSVKQTEKQITKYYKTASQNVVGSFLNTYNHILRMKAEGKEPTPADLYKLDAYWQAQATIKHELQKLGDKQSVAFLKRFTEMWGNVYETVAVKDGGNYNRIDEKTVQQMIKSVWCADGKSWSDRVWENTEALQEALNEELINCVLTGADERNLRQRLMYDFNVSYNNADTLIKTEMAHIQTQAAQTRYKDAGVEYMEVWADEDERRCEVCGKLHQKKYSIYERPPIPAHPRCRCCILPVIDD